MAAIMTRIHNPTAPSLCDMSKFESKLAAAATTAVEKCASLKPTESCVIITDHNRRAIADALFDAAQTVTDTVSLIQYPPGSQHGEEPPAFAATAMSNADVFFAPTTKSISHTRARGEACDAGARGATLPGITQDVFTAGLDADYQTISEHSRDIYEQVTDADEIRVTSPAGTDLRVTPGEREWYQDTGSIDTAGAFSNLPAGEVFTAPTTATGSYVVDGTMRPHGRVDPENPLEFDVEDGTVSKISDDAIRNQIETAAETVGDAAYNLAELGIGTNVGVNTLVGSVLLDEKAAGTVHVAIGDNAGIGGETDAPLHLDGIIQNPTVYVDDEKLSLPA
ncbi:MAG: leucyl aminopeptidase (aminopeptidase T) [Haloquadratum walsbyi J07HQW2]|uniref:Leucyl aminopeptidase (Aminopeptidase T) n=2 Tax=Haloquadratum walsbyi TaxID=293091 RepID=U1PV66_9EURY|nr:MAG: leucyl aminopeptidase (aminopeptidase T) [Haloquadratum walsbyi J07HQW2]